MKLDAVTLFAATPYSIRAASASCIIGLAFERQRGVHAIGSDRRQDFDAWPGDLAVTTPGLPIYSESMGGEYLAVHVALPNLPAAPRAVLRGARHAVLLGAHLRAALLARHPDTAQVEELALLFADSALAQLKRPQDTQRPYDADRAGHARVLDYIEAGIDGPLGLDDLACLAGLTPLRFLRSFAGATGMTPHAFITERRLQRARLLLRSTDASVAAIALDCGFAHQSHLGDLLRKRMGVTPAAYRARCRG